MSGTTRNATTSRPVFRFAPSPNGALHLGHAYSALLNMQMARKIDGRLLLRIEDIDLERCRPEFETAIVDDLKWLGIDFEPPARRQSDHFADYDEMLQRLMKDELVYPAFMSRGEVRAHIAESGDLGRNWPSDPDGAPLYPGLERRLGQRERRRRIAEGRPFAWRLHMASAIARSTRPRWSELSNTGMDAFNEIEAHPQQWGDVVLARRDVPTSYHLSVVTDDALQGVTHVVRGQDLQPATSIHRLLQDLLDLPEPVYFHHRLIEGVDGRKLSKSSGDTGICALREAGRSPGDVRAMVGF